jgi:hypothetical protein
MDYRIIEVVDGDNGVYFAIEKKTAGFNWQLIRTKQHILEFAELEKARKYLAAMGMNNEVIRKVFIHI